MKIDTWIEFGMLALTFVTVVIAAIAIIVELRRNREANEARNNESNDREHAEIYRRLNVAEAALQVFSQRISTEREFRAEFKAAIDEIKVSMRELTNIINEHMRSHR